MNFVDLLTSSTRKGNGSETAIPDNWMQGRTTFGGLSAALCLAEVQRTHVDLPPLRSAQITFIGPAGGTVRASSRVLRQGRSATFIEADLETEKGLVARCIFVFGAARPSAFDQTFLDKSVLANPDAADPFFPPNGMAPHFTQHFDVRLAKGARPVSGSTCNIHDIWVRFKDRDTPNNAVSLIAIADMPPPAIMPMMKEFAPVSSINWHLNFLVDAPHTQAGWWLLRSAAEHAREGYSSQNMLIWNAKGDPVIAGRQSVAVFG